MRFFLFFSIAYLCYYSATAQQPFTLSNNVSDKVTSYGLTIDNNYTINDLVNNNKVQFIENDAIQLSKSLQYWLRLIINNNNEYAEDSKIWIHPQLNNTLYYYNYNQQQWIAVQAGLEIAQRARLTGYMDCKLQAKKIDTLYIKLNLNKLKNFTSSFKPKIYLDKAEPIKEQESFYKQIWIATLLIVCCFLLYHLYLYYNLRDKIYLYYSIIQIGGIVYITTFHHFLNALFPYRKFSVKLLPNGFLYYYDTNNFVLHFSILAILYGFMQLTRVYLQTTYTLQKFDKYLRLFFGIYAIQAIISSVITYTNIFYVDYYTIFYDNILIALFLLFIVFGGILAWRKRVIGAKYFLLANIVPLSLMFSLALYFTIYKFNSQSIALLPSFAVVSQAVAFAIAIVWRVNNIKAQLQILQTDIAKTQQDYQTLVEKNKIIEHENAHIQQKMALEITQKEQLQNQLENNQRELASNTLYILQKNELLQGLQKQIQQLIQQQATHSQKQVFKEIKNTLQNSVQLDNDWDKFKLHFEQVHPNFFKELEEKHPNLTPYEVRLSAYLHLKMSAKEIATLLNIDANSVHRAKTRLKKKMQLTA